MSQHSDDSELLKSYLLGAASPAEREAVEGRYMEDAAGARELLLAEDELIDDYVLRALTAREHELFEKNFLCTADRRRRLEFTLVLTESLTLAAGGAPPDRGRGGAPPGGASGGAKKFSRGKAAPKPGRPFDALLEWLDPVYERAAEKYVAMHNRLSRIFAIRGYGNAEELADETLRRASLKARELAGAADPAIYVYTLARYVLMEQEKLREDAPRPPAAPPAWEQTPEAERTHECLERCLRLLSDSERELILRYYSLEKPSKQAARRELAQSLGVTQNTLRIQLHKIRTHLGQCVNSCMEQPQESRQ